jgi:putative transposase
VPRDLKRYYRQGHLHFVTFSCYRRLPLLNSARRRNLLLCILEQTRISYGFAIVGYVVMPEHLHILVNEPRRADLSTAMKALKQAMSRRVARSQKRKDPRQNALFSNPRPLRFWQPRFYDFNVFTAKKRVEKLKYMHRNPVVRGLVELPEEWRWSSYRYYDLGENGIVTIERFPDLTPFPDRTPVPPKRT